MTDKEEKVEDKENEAEEEEQEVVDNPDEMSAQQKLFYFARRGDIEGIKEVAKEADINAVDDAGSKQNPYISKNTALHYAVQSGNLECVKVLYNLEAKLDVANKLGSTPLHIAASQGYSEITKFLIDMKANIEAKNTVQNTPLHCAVYAGHVETVKVILAQLDEPRDSLLEPNGVGMGAAKYTAHEDMKTLLRTYFPKRKQDETEKKDDNDYDTNNNDNNEEDANGAGNDVQEEAPPTDNNEDGADAPPSYETNTEVANGDGDGNNDGDKEEETAYQ